MRFRRASSVAILVVLPGCVHPGLRHPVACPAGPPAQVSSQSSRQLKIDGPPPTSLLKPPYTIVVDDRVVEVIRSDADSTSSAGLWKVVDSTTIKSIEVVRAADAEARFPAAVGGVVHITRCY